MFNQGLDSVGTNIEKEADVLALSGLEMAILFQVTIRGYFRLAGLGGRTV